MCICVFLLPPHTHLAVSDVTVSLSHTHEKDVFGDDEVGPVVAVAADVAMAIVADVVGDSFYPPPFSFLLLLWEMTEWWRAVHVCTVYGDGGK